MNHESLTFQHAFVYCKKCANVGRHFEDGRVHALFEGEQLIFRKNKERNPVPMCPHTTTSLATWFDWTQINLTKINFY